MILSITSTLTRPAQLTNTSQLMWPRLVSIPDTRPALVVTWLTQHRSTNRTPKRHPLNKLSTVNIWQVCIYLLVPQISPPRKLRPYGGIEMCVLLLLLLFGICWHVCIYKFAYLSQPRCPSQCLAKCYAVTRSNTKNAWMLLCTTSKVHVSHCRNVLGACFQHDIRIRYSLW